MRVAHCARATCTSAPVHSSAPRHVTGFHRRSVACQSSYTSGESLLDESSPPTNSDDGQLVSSDLWACRKLPSVRSDPPSCPDASAGCLADHRVYLSEVALLNGTEIIPPLLKVRPGPGSLSGTHAAALLQPLLLLCQRAELDWRMDTCVHLYRYPSDSAIPTQPLCWQRQGLHWIDSLQLSLIGTYFALLQFNNRELLSPGIPSASHCHPNAAAVQALTWQGQDLVSPENNAALHPLAIPIAEGPISFWGADAQDTVTCLLRWPAPAAHPGMEMPIVAMQRGARSMVLVARNPTEYLTRLLLEEDIACESGGEERLLAAELGDAGRELYEAGAYTAANVKKFEAFVIAKVGHFPDVSQSLVQGHRDKGDEARAHLIYL